MNNKENTILFLKYRKKIVFINQDLITYKPKKKIDVDCVIHLASSTNAEKSFGKEKILIKLWHECFVKSVEHQ